MPTSPPAEPTGPTGPESALPSVAARVAAFVAIFVGGAGGAVIGGSFSALQCDGSCDTWVGLGLWLGSLVGAIGVAVVAVLTLRALGEWRSIRDGGEPQLGVRP